jgi:hypothetical protein
VYSGPSTGRGYAAGVGSVASGTEIVLWAHRYISFTASIISVQHSSVQAVAFML